ncbi:cytochrome c oxidase subunit II [Lacunimicrobium album]
MSRLWCLFFMFWPVLALYICWVAPTLGWGFPGDGVSDSPIGKRIDHLFWLIMAITTGVFVLTQIAMGYALWKASTKKPEEPAQHFHGSHTLEVIWTVIPGALLLFIAFYQMDVWADFRLKSRAPATKSGSLIAEVTARQFEWRIRYPVPGKDLSPTPVPGDLYDVNELIIPAKTPVMIYLRTDDVQHSFFLPTLRIKQDAIPGKVIPIWFEAEEPGSYPLLCAELCGWGHYKMGGKLTVLSQEDYTARMQKMAQDFGVAPAASTPAAPTPGVASTSQTQEGAN